MRQTNTLSARNSDLYRREFVKGFVDRWDELIDWDARSTSEGSITLKTVQADWRELNRSVGGEYDALVCLGNPVTHLHDENDRRKALAEFNAALRHDGILVLDQRNYDKMLDHGFTSKHRYYYCGDRVVAAPEYIDDGLARFKYSFADGKSYTLNMFPLRKNYVRRLLREAGFAYVQTYGDFQDVFDDDEPDFSIHVAAKSLPPRTIPHMTLKA